MRVSVGCMALALSLWLDAQSIEVGGGLGFGTDLSQPALNLHGWYGLSKIDVGVDLVFSLVNSSSNEFVEISEGRSDYFLTARYPFSIPGETWTLYPMVGIGLTRMTLEADVLFSNNPLLEIEPDNNTQLGAFLGAGAQMKWKGPFHFFATARYYAGERSQALIAAGVSAKVFN